jgi:hypothetical protein
MKSMHALRFPCLKPLVLVTLLVSCTSVPPSVPPSSTPSGSQSPGATVPHVVGEGPFVVFQQALNDEADTIATIVQNIATGERIHLPEPWAAETTALSGLQVGGLGVPVSTDRGSSTGMNLGLLSRTVGRAPFDIEGLIVQLSASPDGRSVLALTQKDENAAISLWLFSADREPRLITRVRPAAPWVDGDWSMAPAVWLPDGSWLATPRCACDYGSSSEGWYRISPTGKLTRLRFAEPPFSETGLSVSADSRFLVWADIPMKACGPGDSSCPDGPIKVSVTDLRSYKVRGIATFHNDLHDGGVAVSADGSLIATGFGGPNQIRIIRSSTARVIASARYKISNLMPLAFIDDQTLIAEGDAGTDQQPRTALLLIRFEDGVGRVTRLSIGDIYYSGWVR